MYLIHPDNLELFTPTEKTQIIASKLNCSSLTASVIESYGGKFELESLNNQIAAMNLGQGASIAAKKWKEAVTGKKVIIYGDYDVDGVSSTIIMTALLQWSGAASVAFHIPDRFSEGYGMSEKVTASLIQKGYETLVTVDCGTSNVKPIQMTKEAGLNVLVFDHHLAENGNTCKPDALVNPQIDGDEQAKKLCAASLVWTWGRKVGIIQNNGYGNLYQLAALATLSDVMELGEYNQQLLRAGLAGMRKSPFGGLKHLFDLLGISSSFLDCSALSMKVIPCLNAAGRIDHANIAVNALAGGNNLAISSATLLSLNARRKELGNNMTKEIESHLKKYGNHVFACPSWHTGVLSAVAGRICSSYDTSVAVIGRKEDCWHGSIRVTDAGDASKMLEVLRPYLKNGGGHKGAAGFAFTDENFDAVTGKLEELLGSVPKEIKKTQAFIASPTMLTSGVWMDMRYAEPFGNGRPAPLFFMPYGSQCEIQQHGASGDHSKIVYNDVSLVAFNAADTLASLKDIQGILFRPSWNTWKGKTTIQYIVEGVMTPEASKEREQERPLEERKATVRVDLMLEKNAQTQQEGKQKVPGVIPFDWGEAGGPTPEKRAQFQKELARKRAARELALA